MGESIFFGEGRGKIRWCVLGWDVIKKFKFYSGVLFLRYVYDFSEILGLEIF